jgi:tetratricopeptide (TPR) repeat protein
VLGEFKLVREIGRGGMGVVYEAIQLSLGRRVALKVLPTAAGVDTKQLARFQVETQIAAALHHPHIVPIFAVGCDQGVHYYAMQLVEGRCLAALLRERREGAKHESSVVPAISLDLEGAPAARAAARLMIQAAEALEHAHGLGVLHRDVKPANLLVEPDGHLWVSDFGLARFQGSGDLTGSGDLLGTLRYMSPEQAGGGRILDARTDIYSLGATLYELLTDRPAFDGDDRQELIRRITCDEPIGPRKLNPTIPRDLETIVGKAMAKECERRYATASELALDLRRFCEDRPILARRPTLAGRVAAWSRRHRTATATAAVVLLLVAVGCAAGMLLLWNEQRRTLAALAKAEAARARERQALIITFSASDRIAERALLKVADLSKDSAEIARDREFCRKALTYYEKLASDYGDDRSMRAIVAAAYHRIGFIRTILGEGDAKRALLHAIALYQRLIERDRFNEELRAELAIAHGDLLILERKSGLKKEAFETLQTLVDLRQRLVDDFPANGTYPICVAYYQIELLKELEDAGRADDAEQIRQRIRASVMGEAQAIWNDARLCNNLAWALASRRQSQAQDTMLAIELARKAVQLEPKRGPFWNTMGVAHYRAGQFHEAIRAFGESMQFRDGGDANDWLFLAMAYQRLNETDRAKGWLDRSLSWITAHPSDDPQLAQFRDEAALVLGLVVHMERGKCQTSLSNSSR